MAWSEAAREAAALARRRGKMGHFQPRPQNKGGPHNTPTKDKTTEQATNGESHYQVLTSHPGGGAGGVSYAEATSPEHASALVQAHYPGSTVTGVRPVTFSGPKPAWLAGQKVWT